MAVNSTSSTAMAPMTSFARRERVGTDTGGRMATSGLLQMVVRQEPRSNTVNAPPRSGFPSGTGWRGAAGAQVVERGQGVVEGRDPRGRHRRVPRGEQF